MQSPGSAFIHTSGKYAISDRTFTAMKAVVLNVEDLCDPLFSFVLRGRVQLFSKCTLYAKTQGINF